MSRKTTLSDIYIFMFILWSSTYTLIRSSNASLDWGAFATYLYRGVNAIVFSFLLLKAFYDFYHCKRRQRIMVLVLVCLLILSRRRTSSDFLYPLVLFAIACRHVDLKKLFDKLATAQLVCVLTVIILSLVGVISSNDVAREGGQLRRSLGFEHPNTLGTLLFQISALYFLKDFNLVRFRTYLIVGGSFVVAFYVANSRNSSYLIFLLFLGKALHDLSHRKNGVIARLYKWLLNGTRYMVLALLIFSVIVSLGYFKVGISDETFNTRFINAQHYLNYYPINLFGRDLIIGYSNIKSTHTSQENYFYNYLYTLDNAYIYLLLGFGIVITIVFLVIYIVGIKKFFTQGNYAMVFILLLYAVSGLMETSLIRFYYNYFLLAFATLIWSNKDWSNRIRQ